LPLLIFASYKINLEPCQASQFSKRRKNLKKKQKDAKNGRKKIFFLASIKVKR
jgi:hypothetical protein